MPNPSSRPTDDLDRVAAAQDRFVAAIAGLDDQGARSPSRLPGWSVAHLVTHVARNADSHLRRAEAAARGEVVDQYPGGFEGRAAEIERGSSRPAAALVADVEVSAAAMMAAFSAVPDAAWSQVTRDVGGRERPLAALPARRWQELEVHLVDLDVGFSHRDWSDDFVSVWLPYLRAELPGRLAPGAVAPALDRLDRLDERDELAWLYGRIDRPDLPVLTPWA